MIVYDDPPPPLIEADGNRWSITPRLRTVYARLRVNERGGRPTGELHGGDGAWHRWSEDPRFHRSPHAREAWYQEVRAAVYPHARIRVLDVVDGGDPVELDVYDATAPELELLDRTFPLVPVVHLARTRARKPLGFHVTAFVGARADPNFTGGLNPARDAPDTPYDDRLTIQLNRTRAVWENDGGVWGTVLHEIGHNQPLWLPDEVMAEVAGIRVSTNDGRGEPICDAYALLLRYGSADPTVRAQGSRHRHAVLASRRMRDALRGCPAFSELSAGWQARLAER